MPQDCGGFTPLSVTHTDLQTKVCEKWYKVTPFYWYVPSSLCKLTLSERFIAVLMLLHICDGR